MFEVGEIFGFVADLLKQCFTDGKDTVQGIAHLVCDTRGDTAEQVHFAGDRFSLRFAESDPEGTLSGEADAEVDLTCFHIMNALRKGIGSPGAINYLSCLEQRG